MPAGEGAVADLARTVADVYRQAEDDLIRAAAREVRAAVDDADRADPDGRTIPAQVAAVHAARLRAAAERIGRRLRAEGLATRAPAVLEQARRRGDAAAARELDAWLGRQARTRGGGVDTGRLAAYARQLAALDATVIPTGLRAVQDVYRDAIAATVVPHVTGTLPRRIDMAKTALDDLRGRGVTGFVDRAGRRWDLATYVEQATRTTAARVMVQAQVDRITASGGRLVYVSNHANECTLCRPFEHRVLAITGPVGDLDEPRRPGSTSTARVDVLCTLAEAIAAGLFHPSCRHSLRAYRPGVTRLEPDRAKLADPAGERDQTRLRALERQARAARRWEATALDDHDRRAARNRLAVVNRAIAAHVKASPGVARRRHREHPDRPR